MASQQVTYLAGTPDGKIVQKTAVRAISGVEVLVRVTHSGLCGTDVHDVVSGCGLGHEGVGIIEKVCSEVRELRVGQRVGWGLVFFHSLLPCSFPYIECNSTDIYQMANFGMNSFCT